MIVYWPLQAGLLTGKFDRNSVQRLDANDWRLKDKDFQEPRFSINVEFVEKLRETADNNGKKLSHLAIAWVLRHLAVTSAIVGARNPQQIEENAGGADWQLSPHEISKIDALLAERDHRINGLTEK